MYVIKRAHPEWQITALVRNSSKGAKVASQYPDVRLVYGDLDSVDLISQEAKDADIVYRRCLRSLQSFAATAEVS